MNAQRLKAVETHGLATIGAAEGIWNYYIRPEITAKRTWTAIGALVVAHELLCPPGELLSEGADRAIQKYPWLPWAGTILAGHVLNMVDEKYDLVHHGVKLLKGSHA